MNRLSIFLLSVVLSFNAFAQVSKENPYEMIEQVAEITFKRVANSQDEIKSNPNVLKDVVREELIPYVDYRYAAL